MAKDARSRPASARRREGISASDAQSRNDGSPGPVLYWITVAPVEEVEEGTDR
jgi:hypothetical protein